MSVKVQFLLSQLSNYQKEKKNCIAFNVNYVKFLLNFSNYVKFLLNFSAFLYIF